MEYLRMKHTSKKGIVVDEQGHKTYTGDRLEPYREHLQTSMFHGFDFDSTMLRTASMNLMLHGVDSPHIHYQDTLSSSFSERFPAQAASAFDVVFANPPFTGSLDHENVHPSLIEVVNAKKTELLFVALILRLLRSGGRCAMIVPDGVLFNNQKGYIALRRYLLEQNRLDAVISLPKGVFNPYARVSTAIIVFRKGRKTRQVFFYRVANDGFSLDDRRVPYSEERTALGPTRKNDLPDVVARWKKRKPKRDTDRESACFFIGAEEIAEQQYDLSVNRYQEEPYDEVEHEPPRAILARLRQLEQAIAGDLTDLEELL